MEIPTDIPEARPLTAEEIRLARFMLEHGGDDARSFLPQLERTRAVSRCPCGCATLGLEVDGFPRERPGGMRMLAESSFQHGDDVSGIFIAEHGGALFLLEVYGLSGDSPRGLPTPEMLDEIHPAEPPAPRP